MKTYSVEYKGFEFEVKASAFVYDYVGTNCWDDRSETIIEELTLHDVEASLADHARDGDQEEYLGGVYYFAGEPIFTLDEFIDFAKERIAFIIRDR